MAIDWSKCIICQEKTSESLKCPLDSCGKDGDKFYSSFLENLEKFRRISALPTKIFFENGLTADDLPAHHAPWHKSCHLKYSTSKLTRAKKRKADCNEPERMPRKHQAMNFANCLLCERIGM